MSVRVELSSGLRRFAPAYDPERGIVLPAEGLTPVQLLKRLGVPEDEAALVMINRRPARPDQKLEDGDLAGLFPVLGGG